MSGPLTGTACRGGSCDGNRPASLGRGSTAAGQGFPLQSQSTWAENGLFRKVTAGLTRPFCSSPGCTAFSAVHQHSKPNLKALRPAGLCWSKPQTRAALMSSLYPQAHQAPLALGPGRVTCAILPRPLWLSVLWPRRCRLLMLVEHTCSAFDGVHQDRPLSYAELSALSLA